MKLIKEKKYQHFIDYFYENRTLKRVFGDVYINEIIWFNKYNDYHKEDGAAIQNCWHCIKNKHYHLNNKKNKKHFYLCGVEFSSKEFAKETNHKICLICNDFCNQKCFN